MEQKTARALQIGKSLKNILGDLVHGIVGGLFIGLILLSFFPYKVNAQAPSAGNIQVMCFSTEEFFSRDDNKFKPIMEGESIKTNAAGEQLKVLVWGNKTDPSIIMLTLSGGEKDSDGVPKSTCILDIIKLDLSTGTPS